MNAPASGGGFIIPATRTRARRTCAVILTNLRAAARRRRASRSLRHPARLHRRFPARAPWPLAAMRRSSVKVPTSTLRRITNSTLLIPTQHHFSNRRSMRWSPSRTIRFQPLAKMPRLSNRRRSRSLPRRSAAAWARRVRRRALWRLWRRFPKWSGMACSPSPQF